MPKILVGIPYLRQDSGNAVLCAPVTLDGQTHEVWFSVEQSYARYLTHDRADAFVVGLLPMAMRLGLNIRSQAPITRRLHYQLTQYLIPAMAENMAVYHSISIDAPVTDTLLPCENAVGTGWTGGVDSMYTLMTHIRERSPDYPLTHLLIANVGTLESDHNTELLHYMAEKARTGIARELDLGVVAVDSNLHLLWDAPYLSVAVFRLPAAVLALQRLFGVFLHSGAYEFSRFAFVAENTAYYEPLPLNCFETDCTVFYSTGSQISRIRKLQELSDYSPAQRYLHPCIYAQRSNCGSCGKCLRTQGALYALGTLENFRDVFDVPDFYANLEDNLAQILAKQNSQHYGEVIRELANKRIPLSPKTRQKARILRAATIAAQNMTKKDERQ